MKHYITSTTLLILAVFGIIVGAFGSEILESLFCFHIPSFLTLMIGVWLAWAGIVALIREHTDWLTNYGGK